MSDKEKIEAVLEIVEEAGPDRDGVSPLGRVLRPGGTRSFAANTGVITVANPGTSTGKYQHRTGQTGAWEEKHLPANRTDNWNPGANEFFVKNNGTVDLDVTP